MVLVYTGRKRRTAGKRHSAFLALPGELRNQIYQILLPDTVDQYLDRSVSKENELTLIPLLLVCRQICAEVLSTLYTYSQLNVIVAEDTAPVNDDEIFSMKKDAGMRVTKAVEIMKHFQSVKVVVCLRPVGYRTTHRVLENLRTLLASMKVAEKNGKMPPRTVELRTCLHFWRGNGHLGAGPYRSDFDGLLNATKAYENNAVIHCLVPEPLEVSGSMVSYQVSDHNRQSQVVLAHFRSECFAAGMQLVEDVVDAPGCILPQPACLLDYSKDRKIDKTELQLSGVY